MTSSKKLIAQEANKVPQKDKMLKLGLLMQSLPPSAKTTVRLKDLILIRNKTRRRWAPIHDCLGDWSIFRWLIWNLMIIRMKLLWFQLVITAKVSCATWNSTTKPLKKLKLEKSRNPRKQNSAKWPKLSAATEKPKCPWAQICFKAQLNLNIKVLSKLMRKWSKLRMQCSKLIYASTTRYLLHLNSRALSKYSVCPTVKFLESWRKLDLEVLKTLQPWNFEILKNSQTWQLESLE